jgi:TRAP-type C4-dicarboxylate transport system permease small subunit
MSLISVHQQMDRFLNALAKVEKVFGIFAMAFIVVINVVGIGSRYLLDQPIIFIHELTILGAVWLFFIGMGLVFKVHSDITVEFVSRHFGRRLKLIDALLVDLLTLFFAMVLAWQTVLLLPYTRGESHVLSFALGLPDEIYFYPIGLSAVSIFVTIFHNFFGRLIDLPREWSSPETIEGEER